MRCPGIHCPGCDGGPSGLLWPVGAAAVGYVAWRAISAPSGAAALADMLTTAVVAAGLAAAGLTVAIVVRVRRIQARGRAAVPIAANGRPTLAAAPSRPLAAPRSPRAIGASRTAPTVTPARTESPAVRG